MMKARKSLAVQSLLFGLVAVGLLLGGSIWYMGRRILPPLSRQGRWVQRPSAL